MAIEMWPVVGSLLVFFICTHVQSQLTAQQPDSVQPCTTGSILFKRGVSGYYGNNVTLRATYLVSSATNKVWYDEETALPNGWLRKFFLSTQSYGQLDEASRRIRLQIWRPVDLTIFRLDLVWQQVVQVAPSAALPMVYTFTIDPPVAIVAGDRIGWTYEGVVGPIAYEYDPYHRTRWHSLSLLPDVVGLTVDFDGIYFPTTFSIAVYVDTNQ